MSASRKLAAPASRTTETVFPWMVATIARESSGRIERRLGRVLVGTLATIAPASRSMMSTSLFSIAQTTAQRESEVIATSCGRGEIGKVASTASVSRFRRTAFPERTFVITARRPSGVIVTRRGQSASGSTPAGVCPR